MINNIFPFLYRFNLNVLVIWARGNYDEHVIDDMINELIKEITN